MLLFVQFSSTDCLSIMDLNNRDGQFITICNIPVNILPAEKIWTYRNNNNKTNNWSVQ